MGLPMTTDPSLETSAVLKYSAQPSISHFGAGWRRPASSR